jgi:predicted Rossmann fold nucleotide-binding protein DprA/Smf involved in DNA uptake
MKTIIAGSRTIRDMDTVTKAIMDSGFSITAVVSGMAAGVDSLAVQYAIANGIEYIAMPADWSQGRGAGYRRNEQMAEVADALIAVWDGISRGTMHMINIARKRGLKVYVYNLKDS